MPSATQIRKERIEVLLQSYTVKAMIAWIAAKCEKTLPSKEIIEPIYWKARTLFPTVRPKTCKSYAEAVFAIIIKNKHSSSKQLCK